MGALWNLLCFAVAIGILVTIHEGGHFLAARWCGVKVERFSIGFGKIIWQKTDKHGTQFAISLIPLGGYVKMKGESRRRDDDEDENNLGQSKRRKFDYDDEDWQQAHPQSEDEIRRQKLKDELTGRSREGVGAEQEPGSDKKNKEEQRSREWGDPYVQYEKAFWRKIKITKIARKDQKEDPKEGLAPDYKKEKPGPSDYDDDSFASKKVWQRAVIIGAGPAFNILLAFFLYIIVNLNGIASLYPVTGDVRAGSLADKAGLQLYDQVVAVDGREVNSWSQAVMSLVENIGSTATVEVKPFYPRVQRDPLINEVWERSEYSSQSVGRDSPATLTLDLSSINLTPQDDLLSLLGIKPCVGEALNIITQVQHGSAAAAAGLQPYDEIVSVNGVPTPTWYKMQDEILKSQGRVELTVRRGGVLYATDLVPSTVYDEKLKIFKPVIGVGSTFGAVENLIYTQDLSFAEAVSKAASDTYSMSLLIVRTTYLLVTGEISAQNISGPISIARGAGQSASIGLVFFISFLAAISVNLGILNLVPIPVLDGGQLLFLAYEAVFGHEPDAKVQMVLTALGFSFLITLSLLAIFNDLKAL